MSSNETRTLNTLIESVVDSVHGYRDAAEDAENPRLKSSFLDCATERQRVLDDLRSEARRLGASPGDDGTVLGAAHRAFLDIKDAVTGKDDAAIKTEVERGEKHLADKFQEALGDDDLDAATRGVIQSAYSRIQSTSAALSGGYATS